MTDWRDSGFRQRRPSSSTSAWVEESMGPGSRVVGHRRLTGGVCSAVHRLTVERRGVRTFVVLRQYPAGFGLWEPLEQGIANLGVVAGSGLPVPRVLAPPRDPAVFLHGDFLPVNLLWSRGRITGLTDWNSLHRGSRAIDIGHCRRFLAALWSPGWAEELGSLYESVAGVRLDPWWDLYALLHYDDSAPKWLSGQVAGRRPVDLAGMTSRVEAVIEATLRRLG